MPGRPSPSYIATASPGGATGTNNRRRGIAQKRVVSGLTNGVSYTFTVVAVNTYGDSSASTRFRGGDAGHGAGRAHERRRGQRQRPGHAQFHRPANNGGNPITGYTATSNPGNFTGTSNARPPASSWAA